MVTLRTLLADIETGSTFTDAQLALELSSLAPLDKAKSGQVSFLASAKFRRHLQATSASVVFLTEKETAYCPEGTLAVQCADPYLAYAKVSRWFDLTPELDVGIHSTAVIDPSADISPSARIGANVVIGKNVNLADGVQIGANSVLADGVTVGRNSRIAANVTVNHRCIIGEQCAIQSGTVVGSNGFGYARNGNGWQPIAQVGRVIIGDRVEIGANCTIDRGAIDDTLIADDVIIDNLVQIAHNVQLGQGVALAAQVGIAGSTDIGDGCTFGGQSGIAGHIKIAENSHFTGQSMVTKGTSEAGLYSSGIPAQSNREWRKMVARVRQLESIIERIAKLEAKNANEESE